MNFDIEKIFERDLEIIIESYKRNVSPIIIYTIKDNMFTLSIFLSPLTRIFLIKKEMDKTDLKKTIYLFEKDLKFKKNKVLQKSFNSIDDIKNEIEKVKNILEKVEFSGFYG